MRSRPLTLRTAFLPLVLVAAAGKIYLRPVTLAGNDRTLIVVLAIAGVVIGLASGLADTVWREAGGQLMYRATVASIAAWVLGMGLRFGFEYYAYHSSAGAVARFSESHEITGAGVRTTALVLMAFGQVAGRVGVLQHRRLRDKRARRQAAPAHG